MHQSLTQPPKIKYTVVNNSRLCRLYICKCTHLYIKTNTNVLIIPSWAKTKCFGETICQYGKSITIMWTVTCMFCYLYLFVCGMSL